MSYWRICLSYLHMGILYTTGNFSLIEWIFCIQILLKTREVSISINPERLKII